MSKSMSREGASSYVKKGNHYIDKHAFHEEMVAFKTDPKNIERVENGERPIVPESIAKKIMLLCEKHTYNYKFGDRFPFRDEMMLDAVETCIRYIWNYDHVKYDNPFGYFNRIAAQDFIKRIKKEKRMFEKKVLYVQNLGVMGDMLTNDMSGDDTTDQNQINELRENIQKFYDYEVKETPKKKDKKPGALDSFEQE